jgi:hypothetical protein
MIEEKQDLPQKIRRKVKFKWVDAENKDTEYFFELHILVDELTKDVSLLVVDFAEKDEINEASQLWENQISDLKHLIGSV